MTNEEKAKEIAGCNVCGYYCLRSRNKRLNDMLNGCPKYYTAMMMAEWKDEQTKEMRKQLELFEREGI